MRHIMVGLIIKINPEPEVVRVTLAAAELGPRGWTAQGFYPHS
jgi:hypothetical protein